MDACDESSFVRVAEVHRWNGDGTFSCRCALSAFENEPGAVIDGDRFDSAADWILNWFECDPEVIAEAVTAQIWLFWVIPYLLCEMALQWRRGGPGAASPRDRALAPQAIE